MKIINLLLRHELRCWVVSYESGFSFRFQIRKGGQWGFYSLCIQKKGTKSSFAITWVVFEILSACSNFSETHTQSSLSRLQTRFFLFCLESLPELTTWELPWELFSHRAFTGCSCITSRNWEVKLLTSVLITMHVADGGCRWGDGSVSTPASPDPATCVDLCQSGWLWWLRSLQTGERWCL